VLMGIRLGRTQHLRSIEPLVLQVLVQQLSI
jgi:hypothetical protein